jgi:6-pyruvoyl-tetrahydropterin synthase
MKNLQFILLLVLLNFNQFIFSQDTIIQLQEVQVKHNNTKDLKKIIRKIKKNLQNNYLNEQKVYTVSQKSLLNDKDTLISINASYSFNIKSLENNFAKTLIDSIKNHKYINRNFFDKYDNYSDSPFRWISEVLLNKNLNVAGFEFFNYISEYTYEIKLYENTLEITFTTEDGFNGYLFCDKKNYNLIKIAFKNTQPYPFTASSIDNQSRKTLKSWTYLIVDTSIDFSENEDKQIFIRSITSKEVMSDYQFEKFDKKGNVIEFDGLYNFFSTLKIDLSSDKFLEQ